jgi:hypothetical protein
MTREEFIGILKEKRYSYKIEGDKIVVTYEGSLEIMNDGSVYLDSLTSLPPGVVFKNRGSVYLKSLTFLPPGVEFKNVSSVYLNSLASLPPGVEFKNGSFGFVFLNSLIGGFFSHWSGNIDGIDNKRLLNFMISKGIFER